ncbi:MAG: hypothetical protein SVG88_07110 [Halobacteriales archaeon]|nr:hypothetical protein [Halobacteriales archaeon]
MYTGRTERPCCLCGANETETHVELPPRAVQLLADTGSIAWRDIVGEVSIYFCADDWSLIVDLVTEMDMNPLGRCSAARASFSIREDFEAYLNQTKAVPDQTDLERRMLTESKRIISDADTDPHIETRDLVEAKLITMAFSDLGIEPDH